MSTAPRLASQRAHFDMPDDVAYLNCGYMSPLSKVVVEAGTTGLRRKMQPWHIKADDFFMGADALRAAFAELVGCQGDDVAVLPSVSYGVEVAARNLPLQAGQFVVVAEDQFPSHVYPWRERCKAAGAEVRTVARPADGDWTRAALEAIGDDVGVVALPHVHWTDGALFDLEAIGARARAHEAALVLDVTQSLGAAPVDLAAVQPDFLVAASYKWLMGPYGLAMLYASERWQTEGAPLEHNWINRRGAQNFARLVDYEDAYAPGARRFDVGERSNFALVPAAEAGVRQVLAWGVPAIEATLAELTAEIAERAKGLGFQALPAGRRGAHYLGLRREAGLPPDLLGTLASDGVFVSVRGASVRVTPHVYNQAHDVERLCSSLERALR